jgi:dethiobiotin synthetase
MHELPQAAAWPPVLIVTGTGTGVGKTITTAALAAQALAAGRSVCVVKPVQTGVISDDADVDTVRHLLGSPALTAAHAARLRFEEYVRLPQPLAPQAAARLAGVTLPPVQQHAAQIAALVHGTDLVLVEGAGGVLVRLDDAGGTIASCARLIPGAQAVVVTGAGLGTLNVTELTVEALRRRDVPLFGLVIGDWPADPGPAEMGNLADLPRLTGVPLLGVIPDRRGGAVVGPPMLQAPALP